MGHCPGEMLRFPLCRALSTAVKKLSISPCSLSFMASCSWNRSSLLDTQPVTLPGSFLQLKPSQLFCLITHSWQFHLGNSKFHSEPHEISQHRKDIVFVDRLSYAWDFNELDDNAPFSFPLSTQVDLKETTISTLSIFPAHKVKSHIFLEWGGGCRRKLNGEASKPARVSGEKYLRTDGNLKFSPAPSQRQDFASPCQ